ncbi:hypothetical protein ABIF44_005355 [Bradyrhizobium japonicum]|nr:hypothetical protein [Bradyrhizobium japonicum]MCS3988369.1 hypothetical protein [Bradyrhizobium japonicum]MCS4016814.1 hypothetical protein [Bradyrhizobium japonicum]MCS4203910.1 hypothetical protein [Bradyrhizobium japonicum]MDH6179086.1 hypothetical protein [Bradyrhizobium japonicum]
MTFLARPKATYLGYDVRNFQNGGFLGKVYAIWPMGELIGRSDQFGELVGAPLSRRGLR